MSEVSQDHSQILWFTRKTHRTQHRVILMAMIYFRERIWSKISKRKRCMGQSPEETRHKLPRVFFQWSHTGHAQLPGNYLGQNLWNVVCQGSSLELQCPRFKLEADIIGTYHVAHTKTPVFIKTLLSAQFNHSEPFLLLRLMGTPLKMQVPRYQPRVNLSKNKQAFQKILLW